MDMDQPERQLNRTSEDPALSLANRPVIVTARGSSGNRLMNDWNSRSTVSRGPQAQVPIASSPQNSKNLASVKVPCLREISRKNRESGSQ
jgi:hypothetical protein